MPSGSTEMGLVVQEKDPRKNEGVQKIKMHFHWSWTCKSYTINHSHLKIRINGPECWGSHMVCLCNIWFGHLFGISMTICQCQVQTCACCFTPRQQCKERMEDVPLSYASGQWMSGLLPRRSGILCLWERAESWSEAEPGQGSRTRWGAACLEGILSLPIYPRSAGSSRGRAGPDAPR